MGLATVFIVIDRHFKNIFGHCQGMVLVKLDMHGAFDLHLWRGRDDLGMEIGRQLNQRLHDALHIHHHGFDSPSQDRKFLVQEIARRRDTLAHQDFVGRAANAG